MFSYCESGIPKTWERDKQMAVWFREQGIRWTEFQRDGIQRGIRNREGWDRQWYTVMESPLIANTYSPGPTLPRAHPFVIPDDLLRQLEAYPTAFQPGGEHPGWKYLRSFAEGRGFNYHRHISKPVESRTSCGRISPYLAWGNISVRQAYQFIKNHPNRPAHRRAFDGMLTRLKWHCHFIQKFEMECSYETTCVNRGYELLEPDGLFIKKWVPELSALPREFIHEPWLLTPMDKTMLGLEDLDYPAPLVDLEASGKAARTKIWGHRNHEQVKVEKTRILHTHTRSR